MTDDRAPRSVLFTVSVLAWLGLIALVMTGTRPVGDNTLEVVTGMSNAARYYMPSRSPAGTAPVETLAAEPTYRGTPFYGALEVGDGPDRVFSWVLDEPPDGPPRFWLDVNNNEDLTDDGDGSWDELGERTFTARRDLQVTYAEGGPPAALHYFFYRFRGEAPTQRGVLYARDWARVGEVRLAGRSYRIGLIENDNDGIFRLTDDEGQSDPRAVSFTIDLNGDGELDTSSDSAEHYEGTEPFHADGESWVLASVSPRGDRVTFRVSEVKVAPKAYIDVGFTAPGFQGVDQTGRTVSLADFLKEHKVVLLDFWATWCGPCITELPHVKAASEQYGEQGFGILGISLDADPALQPGEASRTREQVAAFMRENGMNWSSIYDGKGWEAEVSDAYRVNAIPATFLLDAEGVIRHRDLRGEALAEAVGALLDATGR